ncbi:MAG: helix-hairpin-helix domain-containing protein [Ignavibacteria bacterium]|nr:helix-hairpin-helix domain-containing protein [Ignavibacteria bacterium]
MISGWINKIAEKLHFTRYELMALSIFLLMVIAGMFLSVLRFIKPPIPVFSYRPGDSTYLALLNDSAHVTEKRHIFSGDERDKRLIQPIRLNSATASDLVALPGIGPKLAEKIIIARKMKQRFNKLEELKEISGLGQKTYDKILPYLKLD